MVTRLGLLTAVSRTCDSKFLSRVYFPNKSCDIPNYVLKRLKGKIAAQRFNFTLTETYTL